ncbi:MAG: hypothetical protein ACYC0T_10215 [Ramlibacter sp.]
MATVQLFSSTDMLNGQPWQGQVTSASTSHFTAGTPAVAITFSGSFAASGAGLSGTVDGAMQTRNGAQQLLVSGLAEDAAAVQGVLTPAQSRPELYAYLLRADDTITGSTQPDLLAGFRGADTLDGAAGIDGAFYTGERAGYQVAKSGGAWQVADRTGLDGVDTLVNVERLSFEDVSVALDLEGNAGTVARILGAVFGRHAVASTELAGIGLRLADTGTSAEALVQLALDHRLGPWHTADDVVNLLYTNVVGIPPPQQQVAVYRGWLDSGLYTEAGLGLYAAQTGENEAGIGLAGLAQTGLAFV